MCATAEDYWAIINSQDWSTSGFLMNPLGVLVRFSWLALRMFLLHSFGGVC